jgi:outer membrane receptor protein involved in Fe transport
MFRRIVTLLAFLLFVPSILFPQSGKIHGIIKDAKSNEPLVGANIIIEGTTRGASTDIDGNYLVINVPVGTYTVKVSYVGYRTMTVTNVQIAQGLTTELNLNLYSEEVEVQSVEIVAERPLINKDYTNTLRVSKAEDLAILPLRTVTDAVGFQASVVKDEGSNNLHIRGGRTEEVGVMVDGVAINNDFKGTQSAMFNNLNQNAIEQLQMETGGFNAEYGSAMSGRIGVTTKSASTKYSIAGEVVTDGFMKPEVGKSGGWGYNIFNMSLGGPIIPGTDIASLFIAAERSYLGDNDPRSIGGYKPYTSTQGWSYNGKLTLRPLSTMDIKIGGMGYVRKGQNWDNGTLFSRRMRLFNAEHQEAFDNASYTLFSRLTHNIGAMMFYTAQVGYFEERMERGDPKWMGDVENYGLVSLNPILPSNGTNMDRLFSIWDSTGNVYNLYEKLKTTHLSVQGDLNLQLGAHLLKAGVEFRRYTVRYYYLNTPLQLAAAQAATPGTYADWQRYRSQSVDYYGYTYDGKNENNSDEWWDAQARGVAPKEGPKHPIYLSFYAQDKIELADLVLNFGIRVDHFDAKELIVKDAYNPFGARGTTGGGVFEETDLEASKPYTIVSPRLGFSFPVTDRAVFHAHYGTFTQMPRLQDVLISKTWEEYYMSTAPYSIQIPNPNLKPERTIAYEVGFRQLLTENAAISVTGFYKEIKDLIQSRNVGDAINPAYPNGYETYENVDFGTVKGFDIIFDLRRTKNVSLSINYTYAYANGTGSNPNSQFRISWTQTRIPKVIAPLDFDRRHIGSINLDLRTVDNEGPSIGGLYLLENTGLNFLFTFNSGVPYTQSNVYNPFFGSQTEVRPTGGINAAYGPWNYRLDLRVDRSFKIGQVGLVASLYVLNVLDAKNILTPYRGTGEGDNTGWLESTNGQVWIANQDYDGPRAVEYYKAMQENPSNYGIPRQIRLGLRVEY